MRQLPLPAALTRFRRYPYAEEEGELGQLRNQIARKPPSGTFALAARTHRAIGGVMSLFPPAACPRLIVKLGQALLVDLSGAVRRAWLTRIATDIRERPRPGHQVDRHTVGEGKRA